MVKPIQLAIAITLAAPIPSNHSHSPRIPFTRFLMEVSFDTLAEAMYTAPFACMAHNKFEEGVEDPVFTYANRAALEVFERTWDTMIGTPSRNSAEAAAQEVRSDGCAACFGCLL